MLKGASEFALGKRVRWALSESFFRPYRGDGTYLRRISDTINRLHLEKFRWIPAADFAFPGLH